MAKLVFIAVAFILLVPTASALEINVNVKGKLGGYVEYFEMENPVDSVQKFTVQWYNSESVSCESRMEFRIYEEGGETYETVWSGSREMFPGSSDHFEAYWLPGKTGNYSVKLVIHHCQDYFESEMIEFSVESLASLQEAIAISAENIPGSRIRIELSSESDIGNVAVIPSGYPMGWVFSGENVELAGGKAVLEMEYDPSIWREEKVDLQAVSLDGKYSSGKIEFALEEEKYFWEKHGYTLFLIVLSLLVLSVALNLYLAFVKTHRKL